MIIGIVGKANCGKSTFFKAATLAEVDIANYPFTTIKPNTGIGYVRVDCVDKDFNKKCNPKDGFCLNNIRFTPIQLIDVAGLVPGAHEGKGMGNQFLDDLRQADVLVHIIDCSGSTNEKGEPVNQGEYDPAEDIKFLEIEIDQWYLSIIRKGWDKFSRKVQQEKENVVRAIAKQLSGLNVKEEMIEDIIKSFKENIMDWGEDDLLKLAVALRKLTKPMIIACNKIDLGIAKNNFDRLKKEFPDKILIPCSADSELALREAAKKQLIDYIPGDDKFKITGKLSEKQKRALESINKNVLNTYQNTGVQQVLDDALFKLLRYIAVFPVADSKLGDKKGNILPDCYLIPKDSTALDFAYRLHSDFGDSFVRAIDIKTKRTVGKEHKLKHRDIIEIISGK